ncbi:MAG: NUDIX domain-containing protein [Candidatus Izimaplasma sp.]|nr:NUDIX domain-containing protein [Candidatus Izimaplasma bacterium]
MGYIKYIRSLVKQKKIIMNAAAVIIINKENEILLQHRTDDNFWGLPGGIMELEETYRETALREVKEETGYNIKIITELGPYYNVDKCWPNGDEAHVICYMYVAKISGGKQDLTSPETKNLRFFSYDNLPSINAKDHLEAIHDYFRKDIYEKTT